MTDVARMPRGGPAASCLDRALHTDRLEYVDRTDVDPAVQRSVVAASARIGEWLGNDRGVAHLVLAELADVPDPRILELGAGRGGLSTQLLEQHPTAHATVTDLHDAAVAELRAGPLGEHPRARVRRMDATAIDAAADAFDLAVFVSSLHHLPPDQAVRALSEGTRVARKLLVVDLPRPPAPLHLLWLATLLPLVPFVPFVHDAVIGSLRSYSPSALRALAAHAGVDVELRGGPACSQVTVAQRRVTA